MEVVNNKYDLSLLEVDHCISMKIKRKKLKIFYTTKSLIFCPTCLFFVSDSSDDQLAILLDQELSGRGSLPRKKMFLLAPIGLTQISSPSDTKVILSIDLIQFYKLNGKEIRSDICKEVILIFPSLQRRQDWMNLVFEQIKNNYLESIFETNEYSNGFLQLAWNKLWVQLLAVNRCEIIRRYFMCDKNSIGNEFLKCIHKRIVVLIKIMLQIPLNDILLFCQEYTSLYVYLFCSLLLSPSLRALLFEFDLDANIISQYKLKHTLISKADMIDFLNIEQDPNIAQLTDEMKEKIQYATKLCKDIYKFILSDKWIVNAQFMKILSNNPYQNQFPYQDKTFYENEYFEKELNWLLNAKKKPNRIQFHWEDLDNAFNVSPFISFTVLIRDFLTKKIDQNNVLMTLEKLNILLKHNHSWLNQEFDCKYTKKVKDKHFQQLLFFCRYFFHWSILFLTNKDDHYREDILLSIQIELWSNLNIIPKSSCCFQAFVSDLVSNEDTIGFQDILHWAIISYYPQNISYLFDMDKLSLNKYYQQTISPAQIQSNGSQRQLSLHDSIFLTYLQNLIQKVRKWILCLLNENQLQLIHTELFSYIITLCFNHKSLRIIIWLFLPDQTFSNQFQLDGNTIPNQKKFLIIKRYFNDLSNIFFHASSFQKIFEHLFDQPIQNSIDIQASNEVNWAYSNICKNIQAQEINLPYTISNDRTTHCYSIFYIYLSGIRDEGLLIDLFCKFHQIIPGFLLSEFMFSNPMKNIKYPLDQSKKSHFVYLLFDVLWKVYDEEKIKSQLQLTSKDIQYFYQNYLKLHLNQYLNLSFVSLDMVKQSDNKSILLSSSIFLRMLINNLPSKTIESLQQLYLMNNWNVLDIQWKSIELNAFQFLFFKFFQWKQLMISKYKDDQDHACNISDLSITLMKFILKYPLFRIIVVLFHPHQNWYQMLSLEEINQGIQRLELLFDNLTKNQMTEFYKFVDYPISEDEIKWEQESEWMMNKIQLDQQNQQLIHNHFISLLTLSNVHTLKQFFFSQNMMKLVEQPNFNIPLSNDLVSLLIPTLYETNGQRMYEYFLNNQYITDSIMEQIIQYGLDHKLLQSLTKYLLQLAYGIDHDLNNLTFQLRNLSSCQHLISNLIIHLYSFVNLNHQNKHPFNGHLCQILSLILHFEHCFFILKPSIIMSNSRDNLLEKFNDIILEINYNSWLVNQYFHHFNQDILYQYLLSYYQLSALFELDHFYCFVKGFNNRFFIQNLFKHEKYKEIFFRLLITKLNIDPQNKEYQYFFDILNQGYLLYEIDHFKPSSLKVYQLISPKVNTQTNASNISRKILINLIIVSMYFENLDNLYDRINNIIDLLGGQILETMSFIIDFIIEHHIKPDLDKYLLANDMIKTWKDRKLFHTISIETILHCARHSNIALQILNQNQESKASLMNLFKHILLNTQPILWETSFQQSKDIAYFIKFVDRESLPLAYEKFKDNNRENKYFQYYLKATEYIFQRSIVSSQTLNQLITHHQNPNSIIQQIIGDAKQERNPEFSYLQLMIAYWMQIMYQKIQVPLPPRNTQLITYLLCALRARDLILNGNKSMGKSLIVQVGTGEGKSLIIAMMAIYCVKVLNKRVHILINNIGLIEKDYKGLESFYNEFNIRYRDDKSTSDFDYERTKLNQNKSHCYFPKKGVAYCLRSDLELYFQDCIINEIDPSEDSILLVDEVDDIIVNEHPNRPYVSNDIDTNIFKQTCLQLKQGDFNIDGRSFAQSQALVAFDQSQHLREFDPNINDESEFIPYQSYLRKDNTLYLLDEQRNCVQEYNLGLEFLKDNPILKSSYFFQSIPYMFSKYKCIFGFTGSIGSDAEKEYFKKQYFAWTFDCPPFLDTCLGECKHPISLLGDCVYVYPERSKQYNEIASICARMYLKVPVLIICETSQEANDLHHHINSYLLIAGQENDDRERSLPINKTPQDFVQLFLKYQNENSYNNDNWETIVNNSTQKVEDRYRITITEPFGGRGHDYDLYDEDVKRNGGMLVIITHFPNSIRDLVQYKGRTGRKDFNGQVSYVFCKETSSLIRTNERILKGKEVQNLENIGTNKYNLKLIDKLAEIREIDQQKSLENYQLEIQKGILLNKISESFYLDFAGAKFHEATWPANEAQRQFRNDINDRSLLLDDILKISVEYDIIVEVPITWEKGPIEKLNNSDILRRLYRNGIYDNLIDKEVSQPEPDPDPQSLILEIDQIYLHEDQSNSFEVQSYSSEIISLNSADDSTIINDTKKNKQQELSINPNDSIQINQTGQNELINRNHLDNVPSKINSSNNSSFIKPKQIASSKTNEAKSPSNLATSSIDSSKYLLQSISRSQISCLENPLSRNCVKKKEIRSLLIDEVKAIPPKDSTYHGSKVNEPTNEPLMTTSNLEPLPPPPPPKQKKTLKLSTENESQASKVDDKPTPIDSGPTSFPPLPPASTKINQANNTSSRETTMPYANDSSRQVGHDNNSVSSRMAAYENETLGNTSRTFANLRNYTSQPSTTILTALRVNEMALLMLKFDESKISQLRPFFSQIVNSIDVTAAIPQTNGLVGQGIFQKIQGTFILKLIVKFYENEKIYDITNYGNKNICIKWNEIVLFDQCLEILPEKSLFPPKEIILMNAIDGSLIADHGSITISYGEYLNGKINNKFIADQIIQYHGIKLLLFDQAFSKETRSGIVLLSINLGNGEKRFVKRIKYIFYKKVFSELNSTTIQISPSNLKPDEMRMVLSWNEKPNDLDLHAFFTHQSQLHHIYYGIKNNVKKLESPEKMTLDIDVTNGNGPETLTFIVIPDVEYRFFVSKYSKEKIYLKDSGAKIDLYYVDENLEQKNITFRIPTDELPVITNFFTECEIWSVMKIHNQEFSIVNKIGKSSDFSLNYQNIPADLK